MKLNPQTGNMYAFVTNTGNTVKGECPHDCSYCFMKVFNQLPLRFDARELDIEMPDDELYIFCGSSCDMWADDVPSEWIKLTLEHCRKYPSNKYLFQTKNPLRFLKFLKQMPPKYVLAITLETNRNTKEIMIDSPKQGMIPMSKAPPPEMRAKVLAEICAERSVTIEPISEFDLDEMVELVKMVKPSFVSIGANSKGTQLGELPEPSEDEVKALVYQLRGFTTVILKSNLKRIAKIK